MQPNEWGPGVITVKLIANLRSDETQLKAPYYYNARYVQKCKQNYKHKMYKLNLMFSTAVPITFLNKFNLTNFTNHSHHKFISADRQSFCFRNLSVKNGMYFLAILA